MKLEILFIIVAVILFAISRLLKNDDDKYEWIDAEATIVSESEGEVNIAYFAEAYINGELRRGVSVHYKKSEILFSKGDKVRIKYHPLDKSVFNKFEFKLDDPRLEEVETSTKPWSTILFILSIICAGLAVMMLLK